MRLERGTHFIETIGIQGPFACQLNLPPNDMGTMKAFDTETLEIRLRLLTIRSKDFSNIRDEKFRLGLIKKSEVPVEETDDSLDNGNWYSQLAGTRVSEHSKLLENVATSVIACCM